MYRYHADPASQKCFDRSAVAQHAPRLALFRDTALAAATDAEVGAPVSLMPISWWGLTGFFTAAVLACVTFLATATFPRKESAPGILRYSLGEIRLTAPRAGIVTNKGPKFAWLLAWIPCGW